MTPNKKPEPRCQKCQWSYTAHGPDLHCYMFKEQTLGMCGQFKPHFTVAILTGILEQSMNKHLRVASKYEAGGNSRGAAQLRAVANLIGAILVHGDRDPCTVLPDR